MLKADKEFDNIALKIEEIIGAENVLRNEPMREHTTFKIGGEAKLFVIPKTKEQIAQTVKIISENDISYCVVGNGSNLLVNDSGYDGVIINLLDEYSDVSIITADEFSELTGADISKISDDNIIVRAMAGARMWKLGMFLAANEAAGFEFATGIPGTIGGAVMMNAGAYGGEIKDVVYAATVCDKDGNIFSLTNGELDFGYRRSTISDRDLIVLEAFLLLKKGNEKQIRNEIDELTDKRRSKQPLDLPSAGSTFKRPEGHYAAQLIDEAGLRGYRIGDMAVSEKHAGFVVNLGNGNSKDFEQLTANIREAVYANSGVMLELEVRKIGF